MTHVQKETAILLKEKGFNLPCLAWYILEDEKMRSTTDYEFDANSRLPNAFTAPELYKVPIWLRKTKGVHVQVGTYHYNVGVYYWESTVVEIEDGKYHQVGMFDTHDLALEAGIIHALKNYVK